MILKDKVAIITGASRGIGKGIAKAMAQAGAQTLLAARNLTALEELKKEMTSSGWKVPEIYQVDVTNEESIQHFFDKALDKYNAIDILVNNAGVTRDNLLVRMSEDDWNTVLDTNLKGTFFATKAAARIMMRQRRGRIINIASVIALVGNAGQANYAASKAGIIALTKSTAKELASRNVLVNAIAPGFIETDMTDKLSDIVKDLAKKSIPMRKFGTVEDIAQTAIYLASDQSKYITGQVISVDGGMVM